MRFASTGKAIEGKLTDIQDIEMTID